MSYFLRKSTLTCELKISFPKNYKNKESAQFQPSKAQRAFEFLLLYSVRGGLEGNKVFRMNLQVPPAHRHCCWRCGRMRRGSAGVGVGLGCFGLAETEILHGVL